MSKVYFVPVNESDASDAVTAKLSRLLDASKALDFIGKDSSVAVKIHFGEEGNVGHVRPEYAGLICGKLARMKARPFLSDTNTLYRGKRTNSAEHLELARGHGFTEDACRAEIIIPDDGKKENVTDVKIDGGYIGIARVVTQFLRADALVGIAHFKGHVMTGFGGALKNIGMGCASREGKLAQHSDIAPIVDLDKCEGCGKCVSQCPQEAIYLRGNRVYIDAARCIGCATCIAACEQGAIEVDWESGGSNIQEKMIEYAGAVLKNKKNSSAYVNFAIKITKECDCLAKDDPRIAPDIGIFASRDPVSIDRACYDAVLNACGKDIFKKVHPSRDGSKQLLYANRLGLGELEYELIEIKTA
jgi:hypothetical protein